MDMEQALETQRLKLLRLLAGLAVALGFVSLAPAVSLLPRWARSYVASVLVRAESAVQSLVYVTACGVLRERALTSPVGLSFPSLPTAALPEDEPSTAALLHRIKVLRSVLEDLPRHAKRMIARLIKPESKPRTPSQDWKILVEVSATADAPIAARIERPPDKGRRPRAIMMRFAPS